MPGSIFFEDEVDRRWAICSLLAALMVAAVFWRSAGHKGDTSAKAPVISTLCDTVIWQQHLGALGAYRLGYYTVVVQLSSGRYRNIDVLPDSAGPIIGKLYMFTSTRFSPDTFQPWSDCKQLPFWLSNHPEGR